MSVSEELRQAVELLRSDPPAVDFAAELIHWLECTADNMGDENAYEKTGDCVDGGTYIEVLIDGDCHVGLSAEWTAALLTARRINQAAADDPRPAETVISDDAKKILEGLNSRLDDPEAGLDWALRQPEVAGADGPNAEGEYLVDLMDFTSIEFDAKTNQWAVTVSDDTDSEVSR